MEKEPDVQEKPAKQENLPLGNRDNGAGSGMCRVKIGNELGTLLSMNRK